MSDSPRRPAAFAIDFVDFHSEESRDRATLRALAAELRRGGDLAGYAPVLERFLAGYPPAPAHRAASGLTYWIAALFWLLYDEGDRYAAGTVAGWCKRRGINRQWESIARAARTKSGREARDFVRKSVNASPPQCSRADVVAGHRVGIEERILAWHRGDDGIAGTGIVRAIPARG